MPGYPADTSQAGTDSPAHGACAAAGDPTQSFDGAGRLYYGFICSSLPRTVASIHPFDSTDYGPDTCGDGPFACDNGLTYARFSSMSAVAADGNGAHVVWSARNEAGQAKIFALNSPNGLSWTGDPVQLDTENTGHQFFPDIASSGGTLSVVFQDSRDDAAYSPDLPPGNTTAGVNSGDGVNAFVATSTNGTTWAETQLSGAGSNPNWEVRGAMRSPFFGDYDYVSADGSKVGAVWTDTRDLVPGTDPREDGADNDMDGFDGAQSCVWDPDEIDAPSYNSPTIADPCQSEGGLDQNIYVMASP